MRVFVLVTSVLAMALSACQGEAPVYSEQFEINAEEESRKYCDSDDGDEQSLTLAGEIVVYDDSGAEQRTGTIEAFLLKATMTCTDGNPESVALTPVGDRGQTGTVSYSYDDNGTDTTATAELLFNVGNATLETDPPVVYEDHRLRTWFGYDTSKKLRVVLDKREELDDTLADKFHISTYNLSGIAFSNSTAGRVSLRLHLPEAS